MMEKCDITVAIPVYERYEFFEEALESVLRQTLTCNILIVDNASSHNRFKTYVDNINNINITYVKNKENLGMVGNWNKCLELTKTKWITILHDDDALHPRFIEYFNKCLVLKKDIKAFVCSMYKIGKEVTFEDIQYDSRLKILSKSTFLLGNISPFPGVIFLSDKKLKFNERCYPIADYDFWFRLTKNGGLYKSNMKLAFYRINEQQTSNLVYKLIVEKTRDYRSKFIIRQWNPFDYLISNYTLKELTAFYENVYLESSKKNDPLYKHVFIKMIYKLYFLIYA